jgi:hypothetical protein
MEYLNTLHVSTAGTLSNLIAVSYNKYEITDLPLTGNLNGDDIRCIREMAGRDVKGQPTTGKLTVLSSVGANIVAGGDDYIKGQYTQKNVIGINMFKCCNLKNIILLNSVTAIGHYAFQNYTGLTSITIPNSLTSIGGYAFYGCRSLREIHSKNTNPPVINSSSGSTNTFYQVDVRACKVYVPATAKNAYLKAYGWNIFANIIEE